MFNPAEVVSIAEKTGAYKTGKAPIITFSSAILAGLFIAIAFTFYTTTHTSGGR